MASFWDEVTSPFRAPVDPRPIQTPYGPQLPGTEFDRWLMNALSPKPTDSPGMLDLKSLGHGVVYWPSQTMTGVESFLDRNVSQPISNFFKWYLSPTVPKPKTTEVAAKKPTPATTPTSTTQTFTIPGAGGAGVGVPTLPKFQAPALADRSGIDKILAEAKPKMTLEDPNYRFQAIMAGLAAGAAGVDPRRGVGAILAGAGAGAAGANLKVTQERRARLDKFEQDKRNYLFALAGIQENRLNNEDRRNLDVAKLGYQAAIKQIELGFRASIASAGFNRPKVLSVTKDGHIVVQAGDKVSVINPAGEALNTFSTSSEILKGLTAGDNPSKQFIAAAIATKNRPYLSAAIVALQLTRLQGLDRVFTKKQLEELDKEVRNSVGVVADPSKLQAAINQARLNRVALAMMQNPKVFEQALKVIHVQ